MAWKKIVSLVIGCTLLMTILSPVTAASEYESIDSITLKQSPYSIGDGWSVDGSFSSNAPYSMAIGKSQYVAVGPYGSIMTSKNGRNWKATSKFNNYQLTTIAYDGSNYYMFGSNTEYEKNAAWSSSELFVSKDALTWEKADFNPGESIHYLLWTGKQFIAVGQKHVYTSSDGQKWTERLTLTDNYGNHYLHYENSTYFIYGFEHNKVYTSKDGVKWTTKSLDTKASIQDFVWAKDRYIGVGNGLFTSKDGISWTKQSQSPSEANLNYLYYDGKQFIAFGLIYNNGGVGKQVSYTSKDGVNWKKHDLSNLQTQVYLIYPVDGGYAGLASNKTIDRPDGTYSLFSKDGISWTYGLVGTSIFGDFSGIATNGKRTVAVGAHGSIIYTDDGSNWKSATPLPYGKIGRTLLFDVAWGANKFVATGNGGIYTSTNGVNWKRENVLDEYGQLRDILWTGKFFIAASQVDGVYYSKDGVKWSKVKSVSTYDHWLNSMVWDGKRIVATFSMYNNGDQYTRVMQTTNGTTWTTLATIDVMNMHIAWNGEKYVAVDWYNAARLYTSTDAKKWTRAKVNLDDENDRFEFITSFDGYFFAFNDSLKIIDGDYTDYNAYYTSKDGVKWREVAVNDPYSANTYGNMMMMDGIKAYSKYIFVGATGKIMYAKELQFEDPIAITILGSTLNMTADDGKPYIEKGTTYVPLKVIGKALGYSIAWDQKTKSVTFAKDGKKTIFKNAITKNGRSYVPLREISESLGYKVNYERKNQETNIHINK
ncbi:copper amine oxidase N-terminal domain-containing protein [Paenibacillus camelliae]|uniref:copper amine oxidase N-terminal domain-containing protein n=1 Tax=Paenibacillus camelliae TaxID=512410 RepID=UPI00203EF57B|nr:copper amine oxidase N-terminal domain-containing protein [Paenibacillus camelliae]MCM3633323.1 copper amine oxidase N-terminal domain-containing protein [Paenibacillus camelliae]